MREMARAATVAVMMQLPQPRIMTRIGRLGEAPTPFFGGRMLSFCFCFVFRVFRVFRVWRVFRVFRVFRVWGIGFGAKGFGLLGISVFLFLMCFLFFFWGGGLGLRFWVLGVEFRVAPSPYLYTSYV